MWTKSFAAGIAGLVLIGGGWVAAPAMAQDIPNILVMTEDADPDTVPRNSRVQRNILSGMQDRMVQRGYRVFDEASVGIDGVSNMTVQGRSRRPRDELIMVARSANQPIDVIVNYEVFASIDKRDFASYARLRIEGELLNAQSGLFMGSFEVTTPKVFPIPVECPRECLLEVLSEEGRDLGQALAAVLADKLNDFFVPQGTAGGGGGTVGGGAVSGGGGAGFERTYTLEFDECSPMTRMEFEPFLVIFQGYLNHRPGVCQGESCEVQYTSTIQPGMLLRNLEKMLAHLQMNGRVYVEGANYKVTCLPQRQRHPLNLNPQDW